MALASPLQDKKTSISILLKVLGQDQAEPVNTELI